MKNGQMEIFLILHFGRIRIHSQFTFLKRDNTPLMYSQTIKKKDLRSSTLVEILINSSPFMQYNYFK